ncbi:MAG: 3-deoxy-manno-octulosonate cytidylyltransferase [Candidatus Omnitrophota bacterium]
MKVIGVIPARYGSTRLEAKVLIKMAGKPMIWHVWNRAKQSKLLNDVIIACDDERVRKAAVEFGANAVLTSKDHTSGSDRIAEVVNPLDVDIVVNIQGDEPLIHPSMIDDLVRLLLDDKECVMGTVIKPLTDEAQLADPNIVKAIIDKNKYAIYFSRSTIPYNRNKIPIGEIGYYKHLGIYGYRKEFLFTFKNLPKSRLEKAEQLEQLRALEAGYKIKTVETKFDTISVDVQEDVVRVEEFLKSQRLS